VRADVVIMAEGNTETLPVARRGGVTGVEEPGMVTVGLPRNLGGPIISVRMPDEGEAGEAIRRAPGGSGPGERSTE
jgi:hypothetical protein